MALFDLLGRSWAMGIVWNLGDGPKTFRQLQSVCESVSPTTLNTRIKELRQALIIERTLEGYALTLSGMELLKMLYPLGTWAKEWAKNFQS